MATTEGLLRELDAKFRDSIERKEPLSEQDAKRFLEKRSEDPQLVKRFIESHLVDIVSTFLPDATDAELLNSWLLFLYDFCGHDIHKSDDKKSFNLLLKLHTHFFGLRKPALAFRAWKKAIDIMSCMPCISSSVLNDQINLLLKPFQSQEIMHVAEEESAKLVAVNSLWHIYEKFLFQSFFDSQISKVLSKVFTLTLSVRCSGCEEFSITGCEGCVMQAESDARTRALESAGLKYLIELFESVLDEPNRTPGVSPRKQRSAVKIASPLIVAALTHLSHIVSSLPEDDNLATLNDLGRWLPDLVRVSHKIDSKSEFHPLLQELIEKMERIDHDGTSSTDSGVSETIHPFEAIENTMIVKDGDTPALVTTSDEYDNTPPQKKRRLEEPDQVTPLSTRRPTAGATSSSVRVTPGAATTSSLVRDQHRIQSVKKPQLSPAEPAPSSSNPESPKFALSSPRGARMLQLASAASTISSRSVPESELDSPSRKEVSFASHLVREEQIDNVDQRMRQPRGVQGGSPVPSPRSALKRSRPSPQVVPAARKPLFEKFRSEQGNVGKDLNPPQPVETPASVNTVSEPIVPETASDVTDTDCAQDDTPGVVLDTPCENLPTQDSPHVAVEAADDVVDETPSFNPEERNSSDESAVVSEQQEEHRPRLNPRRKAVQEKSLVVSLDKLSIVVSLDRLCNPVSAENISLLPVEEVGSSPMEETGLSPTGEVSSSGREEVSSAPVGEVDPPSTEDARVSPDSSTSEPSETASTVDNAECTVQSLTGPRDLNKGVPVLSTGRTSFDAILVSLAECLDNLDRETQVRFMEELIAKHYADRASTSPPFPVPASDRVIIFMCRDKYAAFCVDQVSCFLLAMPVDHVYIFIDGLLKLQEKYCSSI